MSIKLLDEEGLNEIEKMVTSGALKNILPPTANLEEYVGPFHEAAQNFCILRGYRKMLLSISNYIRDKGPENIGKTTKATTFHEMFSGRAKNSTKTMALKPNQQGYVRGMVWMDLFEDLF